MKQALRKVIVIHFAKLKDYSTLAVKYGLQISRSLSPKALIYIVMGLATSFGLITYLSLSHIHPSSINKVLSLVYINAILLLLLTILIGRRLYHIWSERKRGITGAKLHLRLSLIFGFLVITPAAITALFSILSFNSGLESWLTQNNRTVLDQAQAVALAYLDEHKKVIQADAQVLAQQLTMELPHLLTDPSNHGYINSRITDLAEMRNVSEVVLFDKDGALIGQSNFTFALEFEKIPVENLSKAFVAPVVTTSGNRVRALAALWGSDPPLYIYIGRLVDSKILEYINNTTSAMQEYQQLELNRHEIRTIFALIFFLVSLLLMFLAIWLGLLFADQLVRPISELIAAAEAVRAGNLQVTVPISQPKQQPELKMLSIAFNRMTKQLLSQQNQLISTNHTLKQRTQFIENVLSGVTSGVIGLNAHHQIELMNTAASNIIGLDLSQHLGENLFHVIPEFNGFLNHAQHNPTQVINAEINRQRHNTQQNLLVRVVSNYDSGKILGYVITFVDITEFLANQRKAAWSDIARSLAHEIKNPLTPIQLAATRMRRRYSNIIPAEDEVFNECIQTIVTQVDDIKRLVDEFSAFARMPKPLLELCNLVDLCKQAVFLHQHNTANVVINLECEQKVINIKCDPHMISQALNNLLINSIQAIEERMQQFGPEPAPAITIAISSYALDILTISIIDNGIGLPPELKAKLTDPYVTSKPHGTGLGLAIVKKIIEEHDGKFNIHDNPNGRGATATIEFKSLTARG